MYTYVLDMLTSRHNAYQCKYCETVYIPSSDVTFCKSLRNSLVVNSSGGAVNPFLTSLLSTSMKIKSHLEAKRNQLK